MTPQEKAKELFDKYLGYVEAFTCRQQNENAKDCALIAVDEILKIRTLTGGWAKSCDGLPLDPSMQPYWEQVKQEITKL